MDRTEKMNAAAMAAGLRDPDMLKLARDDLSPTEAMRDLARRYPKAFWATHTTQPEQPNQPAQPAQPKSVRDMTADELLAFKKKHGMPLPNPSLRIPVQSFWPRRG